MCVCACVCVCVCVCVYTYAFVVCSINYCHNCSVCFGCSTIRSQDGVIFPNTEATFIKEL